MKSLLVTATAVAMLATVSLAHAEEMSGTVQTVDTQIRSVVLDDGTKFRIAPDVNIEALQPGAKVTLTYEQEEDEKVVSVVVVAQ